MGKEAVVAELFKSQDNLGGPVGRFHNCSFLFNFQCQGEAKGLDLFLDDLKFNYSFLSSLVKWLRKMRRGVVG